MHFTDTVTVYNYSKDPVTKVESWQRTVINGVQFTQKTEKTVGTDGKISVGNYYSLTIPETAQALREYINSVEYNALTDKSTNYTLNSKNNLDMVVLGALTQEISTLYPITKLKAEHGAVGIISSVSDNRLRDLLPHIKVVAK